MNHLEAQNISLGYNENILVENINFNLQDGDIIGLMGLNGCGKTTLFKTLMGGVSPIEGNLIWNGISLGDFSFNSRQKVFSWLPARRFIEDNLKVYELLSYSAAAVNNEDVLKNQNTMALMQRITHLMKLNDFLEREYQSLSEGQKKKIEIAAMFMKDAPVCLLDEPSVFLDISNQKEIIEILKYFAKKENKIIIFSSHDLTLLQNVSEKIWMIKDKTFQIKEDTKKGIEEYILTEYTLINNVLEE